MSLNVPFTQDNHKHAKYVQDSYNIQEVYFLQQKLCKTVKPYRKIMGFFFHNTFSMVKTGVNTSSELFCFYFSGFNSYSRQDIVLQKILQGLQYRLLSLTS